jgi:hypothetical protein
MLDDHLQPVWMQMASPGQSIRLIVSVRPNNTVDRLNPQPAWLIDFATSPVDFGAAKP